MGKVDLIHSVDSLELAKEIDKHAAKQGLVQKVLLQVNIADDENKFGISKDGVENLNNEVAKLHNVSICGYMTIIPFTDDIELRRSIFYEMYKTSIDNSDVLVHNVDKLKMSRKVLKRPK